MESWLEADHDEPEPAGDGARGGGASCALPAGGTGDDGPRRERRRLRAASTDVYKPLCNT